MILLLGFFRGKWQKQAKKSRNFFNRNFGLVARQYDE
jgi:hypothetical protein